MEALKARPVLISFRALAFHGENRSDGDGSEWSMQVKQEIQIGLNVPTVPGAALQPTVKIELAATAKNELVDAVEAQFNGVYEAKFNFAIELTESDVSPWMDKEDNQYVLVAQVFPLAMTHFRRELHAMGFDARNLPLGLPS